MQRDFQKPKTFVAKSVDISQHPRPVTPEKKQPSSKLSRKRWPLLVIAVTIIVIGLLGYGYFSTKQELSKLNDPQAVAQAEAQDLAKEIAHFLELPQDETPTLATVSDASKLQEQVFFQKAQNGDRVLIYAQAQRAVLYRPSTKKVIEYAPVNLGTSEQ